MQLLTKMSATQNEIELCYHIVRGLCLLAAIFATAISLTTLYAMFRLYYSLNFMLKCVRLYLALCESI